MLRMPPLRRRAAHIRKTRQMKHLDSPTMLTPQPPSKGVRPVTQETLSGADYSSDETEFLMAMDRSKRDRRRPFPTWPEVLAVAKSLGYRLVAEPR